MKVYARINQYSRPGLIWLTTREPGVDVSSDGVFGGFSVLLEVTEARDLVAELLAAVINAAADIEANKEDKP